MLPKKENNKTIFACKCGHRSDEIKETKITESIKEKKDGSNFATVESEIETLPLTEIECPKCHHRKAYFWEVQTRAADEAPTKFLKCEKCKRIWRDYN